MTQKVINWSASQILASSDPLYQGSKEHDTAIGIYRDLSTLTYLKFVS